MVVGWWVWVGGVVVGVVVAEVAEVAEVGVVEAVVVDVVGVRWWVDVVGVGWWARDLVHRLGIWVDLAVSGGERHVGAHSGYAVDKRLAHVTALLRVCACNRRWWRLYP